MAGMTAASTSTSTSRPGARQRMIVSTALLIRERGARATSLDLILSHSGAPRGSLYYHFPGGREQLLREATDYAGEYVARRLERHIKRAPLAAVDWLLEEYRRNLLDTDFRAGCPVVAVAVESALDGPDLRDHVVAAFDRWRRIIADGLAGAGVEPDRADELGMLVIATLEGALILSRAYRSLGPLEAACREVRTLIEAELTHGQEAGR
jgi:AcrR family transcriptional regulator